MARVPRDTRRVKPCLDDGDRFAKGFLVSLPVALVLWAAVAALGSAMT